MAQFARPISDITLLAMNGTFADINETVADDADFAWSNDRDVAEHEVLLSPLVDPGTTSGWIFRARVSKSDGGVPNNTSGSAVLLSVRLMQGATQIQLIYNAGALGAWEDLSIAFTPAFIANITNFSDLRLEFSNPGGGGSPANRRGQAVSWCEVECPDAVVPTGRQRYFVCS